MFAVAAFIAVGGWYVWQANQQPAPKSNTTQTTPAGKKEYFEPAGLSFYHSDKELVDILKTLSKN